MANNASQMSENRDWPSVMRLNSAKDMEVHIKFYPFNFEFCTRTPIPQRVKFCLFF